MHSDIWGFDLNPVDGSTDKKKLTLTKKRKQLTDSVARATVNSGGYVSYHYLSKQLPLMILQLGFYWCGRSHKCDFIAPAEAHNGVIRLPRFPFISN